MGDAVTESKVAVTNPVRSGATISAASRILVAVAGTALTIIVAHLLGPTGLGAFVVAQTLIVVATVLATLGAEHGIVYFVSSGRWDPFDAISSSAKLALGCGLVVGATCMVVRVLLPKAFDGLSVPLTAAISASMPLVLAWFYAGYVALAMGDVKRYASTAATQATAALLLAGGLAALDGTTGAVIGLVSSEVLTSAIWVPAIWRSAGHGRSRGESSLKRLRRALSFGVRGWAANALQMVNYRLDLFILSAVSERAAVGQYSVAISVTSVLWLLPQALSDALYPAIARLGGRGASSQMAQTESKSLRHCAVLTTLGTIVLAIVLLTLVVPVFGSGFHATVPQGLTLLPGVALLAMTNPLGAIITGRGRPDLMLRATAIVVPVTVGLYLLLIPRFHAEGAALGSSLSYGLSFILVASAYGRLTNVNALRQMLPTRDEVSDYRLLLRDIVHRFADRQR
jgi:O-antigen/teichoic acid export membrane protein